LSSENAFVDKYVFVSFVVFWERGRRPGLTSKFQM